jgi:hemolysin activation/secretion protein
LWLPCSLEFVARITGQLADGNLLPTEQLGMGGYNSVRGYDLYSVLGDSGYFVNLELRTQPVCLGLGYRLGIGDVFGISEDELTAHIFYDFGDAYLHTPLPIEDPSVDLQSIGLGVRYSLQRRLSLRVDYGWQLTDLGIVGPLRQPRHRVHIGLVVSH